MACASNRPPTGSSARAARPRPLNRRPAPGSSSRRAKSSASISASCYLSRLDAASARQGLARIATRYELDGYLEFEVEVSAVLQSGLAPRTAARPLSSLESNPRPSSTLRLPHRTSYLRDAPHRPRPTVHGPSSSTDTRTCDDTDDVHSSAYATEQTRDLTTSVEYTINACRPQSARHTPPVLSGDALTTPPRLSYWQCSRRTLLFRLRRPASSGWPLATGDHQTAAGCHVKSLRHTPNELPSSAAHTSSARQPARPLSRERCLRAIPVKACLLIEPALL